MGVPGLWDILRPAGQQRAITHLSVIDGFEANPAGRRGLRVGIDASIWFVHATYGKEGENPELRTLFFRCARLMSKPFLPLFVFDGPKRPSVKRKKKVSGNAHWMISGMKQIIEAFGFEWRMAPGEAEAELAYLNRIGVIDGIISDDVDNFLFGAKLIIRNPSRSLSGNAAHPVKNSAGKEDDEHVYTYSSSDILTHEKIGLSVGGLILMGLLCGGDYNPEGLPGCGPQVAQGLARCGFGDSLLTASQALNRVDFEAFLPDWRDAVRTELRTNSQKFLKTKRASLAAALPDTFPDIDVLMLYTRPVTSETERRSERISYAWDREPDLGKLGGICEWFFEWGVREIIIKRFRTVMWGPIVLRILRRAALKDDEKRESAKSRIYSTPTKQTTKQIPPKSPGTPATMIARHFSSLNIGQPTDDEGDETDSPESRLIVKIHSKREHASTDGILEYRLEINPWQLVALTESGIEGKRQLTDLLKDDEDFDDDDDGEGTKKSKKGPKKPPPDPLSPLRIWMPAVMVRMVEPDLVDEFEGIEAAKKQKKEVAAGRKALKAQGIAVPRATKPKSKSVSSTRTKSDKCATALSNVSKESRMTSLHESSPPSSPTRPTAPSSRITSSKSNPSTSASATNSNQQIGKSDAAQPRRNLAPFPMSLSDDDDDSDDDTDEPPHAHALPINKPPVTQHPILKNALKQPRRALSPDVDDILRSPCKSPRKSKEHSSPNRKLPSKLKSKESNPSAKLPGINLKGKEKENRKEIPKSVKPLLVTRMDRINPILALREEEEESELSDEEEENRPTSPSPLRTFLPKKVSKSKSLLSDRPLKSTSTNKSRPLASTASMNAESKISKDVIVISDSDEEAPSNSSNDRLNRTTQSRTGVLPKKQPPKPRRTVCEVIELSSD